MANRGDTLSRSRAKTRDRCVIKAGCVRGSEYDGSRDTKGTILQVQEFDGATFYLVVLDGEKPPGFWYGAECVELKQGRMPPLIPARKARCKVRHPVTGYEATFPLNRDEVDSYITEGFEVVLDDDKEPL